MPEADIRSQLHSCKDAKTTIRVFMKQVSCGLASRTFISSPTSTALRSLHLSRVRANIDGLSGRRFEADFRSASLSTYLVSTEQQVRVFLVDAVMVDRVSARTLNDVRFLM